MSVRKVVLFSVIAFVGLQFSESAVASPASSAEMSVGATINDCAAVAFQNWEFAELGAGTCQPGRQAPNQIYKCSSYGKAACSPLGYRSMVGESSSPSDTAQLVLIEY
jgi:uncharacterized membrane protein